jgi:restriction endonuclease S subunit
MKKLILLTLLLMLSINTLSFAQETKKPKKERNWIVGIGWSPQMKFDINSYVYTSTAYNLTVGYKGWTIATYLEYGTSSVYAGDGLRYVSDELIPHFTIGYQHVFSKESNAKVKPIVGLELGAYAAVVNVGVQ